jgi:hypothetical protein
MRTIASSLRLGDFALIRSVRHTQADRTRRLFIDPPNDSTSVTKFATEVLQVCRKTFTS